MVLDYVGPCGLQVNHDEIYSAYYPTSAVSKIESPWFDYSVGYRYCYLNGQEGMAYANSLGFLKCMFPAIPYNDHGSCSGDLTYTKDKIIVTELIVVDEVIQKLVVAEEKSPMLFYGWLVVGLVVIILLKRR